MLGRSYHQVKYANDGVLLDQHLAVWPSVFLTSASGLLSCVALAQRVRLSVHDPSQQESGEKSGDVCSVCGARVLGVRIVSR